MATTFITWQKVCTFHNIPRSSWKLNGKYNYIEFVSGTAIGSRIDLLDCAEKPSDPDFERFGSLEYTGGWLEEAGEIAFKCFDVLKARIGRQLNDQYNLNPPKMLLTCNPTQNWLYRIFYKPWKEKRLDRSYAFIRSLYNDNPFTAQSYESQLSLITDPVTKARLKQGLWEYNADKLMLVNYDAILDLFINTVPVSEKRYLTSDIARFGGDKILYAKWQGWDLYGLDVKDKQSTVTTEAEIIDIQIKDSISRGRTIIDEDGVGGGVVDHLSGVHGFVGGRSAIPDPETKVKANYRNLRSQCYFILADKINKHEVRISAQLSEEDREKLIADLQQIRREDTGADAPLQVVSKESIKEALGRSPDYSDTMMMRVYFELVPEEDMKNQFNPPDPVKLAEAGVQNVYGGVGWD